MKQTPMPKAQNLRDNPHYFGTYLNMARHNAYMILSYLSDKYTDNKVISEEQLPQSAVLSLLVNSKKPDVTYKLIGDLRQHFPFLRYKEVLNERNKGTVTADAVLDLAVLLRGGTVNKKPVKPDELQPEQYAALLKSCLETLNKLRNSCSHFAPQYTGALNPHFDKTDAFFEIYDAALFRLIDKNKQTKRYDSFNAQDIAALERTPAAVKAHQVPYLINTHAIDEKALTFFICLFLEPKYATLFLNRLAGFQKHTTDDKLSPAEKAKSKAYTMFCCRLPQPKLESSDIMLDMLNELNRCPKELYPVLAEADKDRRFKVVINADDAPQPKENDEEAENTEGSPQEVVLLRHEDRFPYFALRYFDDTNAFPTLRFQVQLGKLLKKEVYDKIIYGEARERKLTKPIFAFTKLKPMREKYDAVNQDDLDHKKIDERLVKLIKTTWLKDEEGKILLKNYIGKYDTSWIEVLSDGTTQLKSVIEQFSPHYNFGEQTIGFKIFKDASPEDMDKYDNYLPNLQLSKTEEKVRGTEPDAFISTYELRNLFFYQYLHNSYHDEAKTKRLIETCAEQFLVDYIANIKRFFKDVKEGRFEPIVAPPDFTKNEKLPFSTDKKQQTLWRKEYKNKQVDMVLRKELLTERVKKDYAIGYTSLPHDIREYLLGYKTPQYSAQIIRKFDAQRKDVKQRLKDLNIALDDKGKETPRESKNPDKDRSPRVGEQATWLAEDILHFMPVRAYIAPSNGKPHDQKMNNDQFRNLQYSLAYFSSNKADIWLYFKELGLIDGDKTLQHPFLFRVDKAKCSLILDFYKAYLIAKDRFLNEAIEFIETANKANSLISKADVITKYGNFLPKEEKKGKAKDYADVPVLLPKGLFNEAISLALNKTKKKGYKGEINTVVYNLEQYIAGDTQDFFGYEHHYQTPKIDENTEGSLKLKSDYVVELEAEILRLDEEKIAILSQKPKNNQQKPKNKQQEDKSKQQEDKKEAALQDLKNKLRDTHRLKERILDREQDIRYHQANDRALWLMVKDRQDKADAQPSDKTNEKHLEIELKDLKLANLEAVLNESVKVRGQVPKSDVQIVEQLPIRRYGDLRRVLKDRRLANLVKYYHPLKEIEHEKIKTEFESYDLRRVRFFEQMYDFEAKVYQFYAHEFPPMVNGTYDYKAFMSRYGKDVKDEWDKIKNYYPHDVFVAIATDHIADKALIPHYMFNVVQLRNKFLHNEIPYFDWLTHEVENESKPFMSDKIFDVAERYYKDLVRKGKNTEGSLV